jgi:hypothetical protein
VRSLAPPPFACSLAPAFLPQVKDFQHDGSWHFQEHPVGAPRGTEFWTPNGPDAGGAKMEHITPDPAGGHAFYQGSTAGYIGRYDVPTLPTLFAGLSGSELPAELPATYTLLVGELSISADINLGGKGVRADGNDQTSMFDGSEKSTFEDVRADPFRPALAHPAAPAHKRSRL